jgi:mRNA-degrading endonuclease RelE of RelBE toxin-antitoxin system
VNVRFTRRADKDFAALSPEVRKAFAKQLGFLLNQLGHPSLRAKKYDEAKDIWQARVNRSWRFYFVIRGGEYIILSIIRHPTIITPLHRTVSRG